MIECDIHLSSDRVPVVIHDSSLDRTTNGSGNIVERDFKELSQLDCGSWFSDQFSGETLPKLEQLLEEVSGKILLNLEIKSKAVVMASGGWINKHIVEDLPIEHKKAYDQFNHAPMLVANVALTNWRFLEKLGITEELRNSIE